MQTGSEEYYKRAQDFRALAAEEKDADRKEQLLEAADEYAELIRLLKEA